MNVNVSRLRLLMLLNECTGVDIWSPETCRDRGVPEEWIDELSDCFESGFRHDRDTIYHEQQPVNQYYGVHDLRLAERIAETMGVDVARATAVAFDRRGAVQALKEAVDEL